MIDDELDPHIGAALRDVAPAPDSVRDQHIATALGELAVPAKRPRSVWLGAAAAIVVLLVGGNALYAALSPSRTSPAEIAMPESTASKVSPVKGSACGADLNEYTIVGTYTASASVQEVWSSAQDLIVVNQASCALLGTFTHPAIFTSANGCVGFALGAGNQAVGTYSVAGAELMLVATPTELQIRDGSCEVIASYPLPAQP
ncbi:MAG: hypothetical protein F2930_03045 [Actinobacteria bacterium]|uniref:Unannotated protein n=1 Tax=freshwater metagenome TaxID=449393 RepID=A0A6J7T4D0_9ZZZZ|nr:hypothetical protein [Actinomycetota bacterium]